MTSPWEILADKVLSGVEISQKEAIQIISASDSETFSLVEQAARIREHFWQNRVRLYMLLNAKSGLCP
ncbi:MAG: biotin synthase BioB, partial [Candidatus Eremiobacteraeota bacterium]|nr:biotin synthase BioB [Candidatus Eremiobacteraeota bacterium]